MDRLPTLHLAGAHAAGRHRRPVVRTSARPAVAAVALLTVLGVVSGVWAQGAGESGAGVSGLGPVRGAEPGYAAPAEVVPAAGPPHLRWLAAVDVLRGWDARRARAFARGDPSGLRALYVPGSRAGAADVRLLRSYARRGLRVEGMRTQLLAAEVLLLEPGRVRLRVVERLVGAEAVVLATGRRLPLPRDGASERAVELRRSASGDWRVAAVRG